MNTIPDIGGSIWGKYMDPFDEKLVEEDEKIQHIMMIEVGFCEDRRWGWIAKMRKMMRMRLKMMPMQTSLKDKTEKNTQMSRQTTRLLLSTKINIPSYQLRKMMTFLCNLEAKTDSN